MSDRWMLTPKQTAEFLGVSENLLAKWRCAGSGPPYAKFGRNIRYPFHELLSWVAAKTVTSTSASPPGEAPLQNERRLRREAASV
jgi:hypothetical protein